ncbi:hypothetical protein ACR9YC_03750 [Parasphingorhabdus sp. DH2-15]|uniref:hypothetical protein n=1 Tax=Parasphingorhabdus sp. DH2-15 TaxID=3444112 RepID=UPI003F684DC3
MVKLSEKVLPITSSAERNDYWQRLQIGGAGLCGILVIAGITTLVLGNASEEAPVDPLLAEQQGAEQEPSATAEAPSEPLVDIGVVPDIKPDQTLGDPEKAASDNIPDLPTAKDKNSQGEAVTSRQNNVP